MGRYANNVDYSELHQNYNIRENASLMFDQSSDNIVRKSTQSLAMDMPRQYNDYQRMRRDTDSNKGEKLDNIQDSTRQSILSPGEMRTSQ